MMQNPVSLTKKINEQFSEQFSEQFIAVLIADSKPLAVVLQLNKPPYYGGGYNPYPSYDKEHTLIGKAYRVLINLEEKSSFFKFLMDHSVVNIMITSAIDADFVNNNNKWVSTVESTNEQIKSLLHIKRHDISVFNITFESVAAPIPTFKNSKIVSPHISTPIESKKSILQTYEPEIEYFNTNKNAFVVGETINFFWKTNNADFIEIKPFGVVTAIGIRGFEMNDDVSTLVVNLIAKNTLTGKIVSKVLEIPNKQNLSYSTATPKNEKVKAKKETNKIESFTILAFIGFIIVALFSIGCVLTSIINVTSGKIEMGAFIFVNILMVPLSIYSGYMCIVFYQTISD